MIAKNKSNKLGKRKTMTKYLASMIKEVNLEKKSDKSPAFKNSKDAMKWLRSFK